MDAPDVLVLLLQVFVRKSKRTTNDLLAYGRETKRYSSIPSAFYLYYAMPAPSLMLPYNRDG